MTWLKWRDLTLSVDVGMAGSGSYNLPDPQVPDAHKTWSKSDRAYDCLGRYEAYRKIKLILLFFKINILNL